MKNYMYVTLFLILESLLFACNGHHPVRERLLEAERLMDHAPDSALALLGRIALPEELPAGEYALWCLLFTQGQDKTQPKHESDSLIRVAVRWFEKKKDPENLPKAYYYGASVYHDLGDAPRAQEYYLKALETGKNSGNHALLGRIYANLGSLYLYQNLFDQALVFEKKAVEHFSFIHDTTSTGLALRNLGRLYTKKHQPDSAMHYYLKASGFATEKSYLSIHNDIASLYKQSGNYPKAFEHIRLAAPSAISGHNAAFIYHNLGDLYRLTGQYDSACHYLSRCLNSPNLHARAGAYLGLSYIEEKQENWPAYALYQKQYRHLRDSIDRYVQPETLQRIQSFFDYRQVELERELYKSQSEKNIYRLLVVASVFLLLLIAGIVYHRRYKRLERERHEKELRYMEQKQHRDSPKRTEDKGEAFSSLYSLPVYRKFTKGDVKIDEKDWEDLVAEIEKRFPDFAYNLKVLLPTIDEGHLRLCYLLKIELPVKRIAALFCLTSQAISHKRKRLYKKLSGQKGSATDLDRIIAEL